MHQFILLYADACTVFRIKKRREFNWWLRKYIKLRFHQRFSVFKTVKIPHCHQYFELDNVATQ